MSPGRDPRAYLDACADRYGPIFTLTADQTHVRCPMSARAVLRDEDAFELSAALVNTRRSSIQADHPDRWRLARRLMWDHLNPVRCAEAREHLQARWAAELFQRSTLDVDGLIAHTSRVLWPFLLRDTARDDLADLLLRTSFARQRTSLRLSPWRRGKLRRLFDEVIRELLDVVRTRRDGHGPTGPQDLLDALLADDSSELNDLDLAQSLAICLDSAMMTTGCAIAWTAARLSNIPRAQRETLTDFDQSDRFVQEVLRATPVMEALNRRATRPTTLGGFRVDAGDTIIVETAALQRDPRLWSHDPTIFEQERWAEKRVHERGASLPFGAGPRYCLGAHAAKATTMAFVAVLAHHPHVRMIQAPRLRQDNLNWPDGLRVELTDLQA